LRIRKRKKNSAQSAWGSIVVGKKEDDNRLIIFTGEYEQSAGRHAGVAKVQRGLIFWIGTAIESRWLVGRYNEEAADLPIGTIRKVPFSGRQKKTEKLARGRLTREKEAV